MFNSLDDEDEPQALYENGRWEWSDITNELVFESELLIEEEEFIPFAGAAAFGNVEFKDDLDLIEQLKFRKRYQRKSEGEEDVIILQDIKDLVLYTCPSTLMMPTVINMLHNSSGDRFLRALIFYCQFYLQTADDMSRRMLELETKIRTVRSEKIELGLREDLEDLRLLVAKEYVAMIMGASDFKKYHHMGPDKSSQSLSKRDVAMFESVLRISIQIVWLALGRKSFNQIELEVNRMFKSSIFNMVEHKLKTNYINKMHPFERIVLIGNCVRQGGKLTSQSPLMNGILCHRHIDFRVPGIGTCKFPNLTPRLRYMEQVLTADEKSINNLGITVGILGLLRTRFDTMLKVLPMTALTSTSSASTRSISKPSRGSLRKSTMHGDDGLYGYIILPSKELEAEWLPDDFPTENMPLPRKTIIMKQRHKWLTRSAQLSHKRSSKRSSTVSRPRQCTGQKK